MNAAASATKRPTRNSTNAIELVRRLMVDDLSPNTIASRLGMAPVTVRALCKMIDPNYTGSIKDATPFGMTQDSIHLRIHLANALYDAVRSNGWTLTEQSARTGLNRSQLIKAMQRPYVHDWSISQIERLANLLDKSVADLLHGGIYKPRWVGSFPETDHFPPTPSAIEREYPNE